MTSMVLKKLTPKRGQLGQANIQFKLGISQKLASCFH